MEGMGEGGVIIFFFFSSRRRHTRSLCDWSSDVCSSDLKDHIGMGKFISQVAFADFKASPLLNMFD